jgi:hypothetical protein
MASNSRRSAPDATQRRKRLYMAPQRPNSEGRSRQGTPVRARYKSAEKAPPPARWLPPMRKRRPFPAAGPEQCTSRQSLTQATELTGRETGDLPSATWEDASAVSPNTRGMTSCTATLLTSASTTTYGLCGLCPAENGQSGVYGPIRSGMRRGWRGRGSRCAAIRD